MLRSKRVGLGLGIGLLLGACSVVAPARVLVEGKDWQLAVARGPALEFREGSSTSGASSYTRPVTLNEASSFFTKGGTTLVAGPVTDEADKVVVTTGAGKAAAELADSHGYTWFWVELPGEQSVSDIVALDSSGAVVDEYTLPPMPGPPPSSD